MAATFCLRSTVSFALSNAARECLLPRSLVASVGSRHASSSTSSLFAPLDTFSDRHIGPNGHEASEMLSKLGYSCMEDFVRDAVPPSIRVSSNVVSDETITPLSERELFQRAKALGERNRVMRSYIGMGYHNAVVPPVILRNVSYYYPQLP